MFFAQQYENKAIYKGAMPNGFVFSDLEKSGAFVIFCLFHRNHGRRIKGESQRGSLGSLPARISGQETLPAVCCERRDPLSRSRARCAQSAADDQSEARGAIEERPALCAHDRSHQGKGFTRRIDDERRSGRDEGHRRARVHLQRSGAVADQDHSRAQDECTETAGNRGKVISPRQESQQLIGDRGCLHRFVDREHG
jgi:hypothetical protein